MRKTLVAIAALLSLTVAPAMAIECNYDQHVQHSLTMVGLDGKLSPYATPRNYKDSCAAGKTDGDRWVLDGFPGQYTNVAAAKAAMDDIWKVTRRFTKPEFNQALAFLTKALAEGTVAGKPFASR